MTFLQVPIAGATYGTANLKLDGIAQTLPVVLYKKETQVREAPSWPRGWANFSLLQLYSRRNAWANLTPFLLQRDYFYLAQTSANTKSWTEADADRSGDLSSDELQVRKTARRPRSWANFSLLWLHPHRNAWADLHILGRPNAFLRCRRCSWGRGSSCRRPTPPPPRSS